MVDLIEDGWGEPEGPGGNTPEFTVSEISGAVKRTLEGAFGRVRVRGEVGRVFTARSGHLYFDVKDERNVLASVCWKGQVARLTQRPEEGMEVIATGRLTTFGGQSKYQLTVDEVEPAGEGALMAMLEKRKRQLAAEGLFAAERKKALPFLPRVIGVVTSPSGAVIRDILHRLGERFPRHVLVWPVAVQGRDCAPQVARAIAGFNALAPGGPLPRPDLLIVARGGGSIEDLWGFNEEVVARAAAASQIPLISAVGHETDTTLIDYVADRRAPTPSAAAEMAVPVRLDLLAHVETLGARAAGGLSRVLSRRRERLRDLARALPQPAALLAGPRQRLDTAAMRLPAALRAAIAGRRLALAHGAAALRPQTLRARLRAEAVRLDRLSARLSPALVARDFARRRERLAPLGLRLDRAQARALAAERDRLARVSARLQPALVARGVLQRRERLVPATRRLAEARQRLVGDRRTRLEALARLLGSLSYKGTLARGFAVVRDGTGHVLTAKAEAQTAGALEIEFVDGRLRIGGAAPPKRAREETPEQGRLL